MGQIGKPRRIIQVGLSEPGVPSKDPPTRRKEEPARKPTPKEPVRNPTG